MISRSPIRHLWCLFSLLFSFSSFAQNSITGKIVSETANTPVIGATVTVKGSNISTATDAEGVFTIKARETDILVVSSIGFIGREISVANAQNIH